MYPCFPALKEEQRNMAQEYIDFPSAGKVHPLPGSNTRHPYRHQLDARLMSLM